MGRRKKEEVVEPTLELKEDVTAEETEALEEALEAEAHSEEIEETKEIESTEVIAEEVEKPARKRQSRKSKKEIELAMSPEHNIELVQEAAMKSMQDMVKHWQSMQEISNHISSQLDKVAHIVKPTIQDFVSTQDGMLRPEAKQSQFVTRFAIAASIVAVLLSVVSMSMSQSARQVALNAEATRVASSQNSALAFNPREEAIKANDSLFPVKTKTKNRR